ncbi:hypothetical protein LS215_0144 [Sulfolobus islandicus L.S.2.15]|uniref:Uncharacterized protein n=1 Tax=Saccharolobus islandicus (strain L.S.2.15 / Lassen \|nr:hypothetical protein LS215_0144 [Sulfolobus islandicus L.S.2.15]AQQ16823.1 A83 [Sulfolobus spindle-shaped virus Lassen]
MRWGRDDTYTGKIRRNSPRFRFNYADYVITIQKAKRVEREVNIRPEKHKTLRVLSGHISYRSLSLESLCFLHELSRLLRGVDG